MSPLVVRRQITLCDVSGLLYRAAFSPQGKRMSEYTGIPWAGPTFIFYHSLLSISNLFSNLIFCIDGYPKARHDLFPAYKAQRQAQKEKDPDHEFRREVRKQLRNWVFETIPTVIAYSPWEEADDCIGSLAVQLSAQGIRVDIISSDKDLWQLHNDMVHIWRFGNEGLEEVTEEMIQEEFGVPALKIPLYKAFFGDKSDNLPKIYRMPTKLATALINGTADLEDALARLPEFVTGDWLQKFQDFAEQARVNHIIATIRKELQVPFAYFAPTPESLQAIFDAYQIKDFCAQDLFRKFQPAQIATLQLLVECGLLNGQTVLSYEELTKNPRNVLTNCIQEDSGD